MSRFMMTLFLSVMLFIDEVIHIIINYLRFVHQKHLQLMHVDTTHTWHWLPDPGLVLTNLRVWGTSLHKIDKISYTQTQQQIISQQWLLSLSPKTFLIKFLFHERLTLWYLGLKCNITCKLCIRVFHWEPRFTEICLRTSFVSWSIQVSRWRQLYENEW